MPSLSVCIKCHTSAFLLCYTKFIYRIDHTPSKSKVGLFVARLLGLIRAAHGNGNKCEEIDTNHEALSGNVAVKCLLKIASLHHEALSGNVAVKCLLKIASLHHRERKL